MTPEETIGERVVIKAANPRQAGRGTVIAVRYPQCEISCSIGRFRGVQYRVRRDDGSTFWTVTFPDHSHPITKATPQEGGVSNDTVTLTPAQAHAFAHHVAATAVSNIRREDMPHLSEHSWEDVLDHLDQIIYSMECTAGVTARTHGFDVTDIAEQAQA